MCAELYLYCPLWASVACSGVAFTFTFYKYWRSKYKAMKQLPSSKSKISSESISWIFLKYVI